jgi:hypothetical protein
MSRKITFLLAALAITLLAAGPAAAATAASRNAPTIVVEPIGDRNVHEEPDGSVITSEVTGIRRTATFPNGRYVLSEEYTLRQTLVDGSGALVYDSVSQVSVNVIMDGETNVNHRSSSDTEMRWGDGRICTFSSYLHVANDKVVQEEFTAPVCR